MYQLYLNMKLLGVLALSSILLSLGFSVPIVAITREPSLDIAPSHSVTVFASILPQADILPQNDTHFNQMRAKQMLSVLKNQSRYAWSVASNQIDITTNQETVQCSLTNQVCIGTVSGTVSIPHFIAFLDSI